MKYIIGFLQGAGFILAILAAIGAYAGLALLFNKVVGAWLIGLGYDGELSMIIFFVLTIIVMFGIVFAIENGGKKDKNEPWM